MNTDETNADLTTAIIRLFQNGHLPSKTNAKRFGRITQGWSNKPSSVNLTTLKATRPVDHASIVFGEVSESAELSIVEIDGQKVLSLAVGSSPQGKTAWRVNQRVTQQMVSEEVSQQPFDLITATGMGHHVVALIAHSPEIGSIRATLADGSVFSDNVTNGVALLFLTLHLPAEWEERAKFEIIDREGSIVSTDAHWVNPHTFPA